MEGGDDCAQDSGEAAGLETNRLTLGTADEYRRTGFTGARRGPSNLRFEEFDFGGKELAQLRLVGMLTRVAEFERADRENRRSEILGHE